MDVYLSILVLITGLTACHGQRCDNTLLRRCREDVARQSDRWRNDLSVSECRKYREDFDCLLDQTQLCITRKEEKEQYGDDILKAFSSLQRNCDQKEGWDKNNCYKREEIVRCENNFPRRIYADTDTCRKYEDLKSCVERALNNYCSQHDKAYLKSYYVNIAQFLPWKCTTSYDSYDNNFHGNRTQVSEQTCCRTERCDDRTRYLNCREDLIQIIDGRSNTYQYYSNQQRCKSYLNKFNCMWWHTYNCKEGHERDTSTMDRSRRFIENYCDVKGDLRRSNCYEGREMRDCDRHLIEETPSQSDVTCREFSSFWNCVQRVLRGCQYDEDEFLQVFYLISKVDDKAWTCSKKESYSGYTPYDDRNTYPYNDPYRPYSTDMSSDDITCKNRAERQQLECIKEKDRLDDEARREDDRRERRVKGCCAAYKFRECLRKVVREACGRERSVIVDELMQHPMRDRINRCQDVDQQTCSASRMLNNAIIIMMAVVILRSIFQQ